MNVNLQECFNNINQIVDQVLLNKQDRVVVDRSLSAIATALNENIRLMAKEREPQPNKVYERKDSTNEK